MTCHYKNTTAEQIRHPGSLHLIWHRYMVASANSMQNDSAVMLRMESGWKNVPDQYLRK